MKAGDWRFTEENGPSFGGAEDLLDAEDLREEDTDGAAQLIDGTQTSTQRQRCDLRNVHGHQWSIQTAVETDDEPANDEHFVR